jgi:hypothetical protein
MSENLPQTSRGRRGGSSSLAAAYNLKFESCWLFIQVCDRASHISIAL